MKVLKKIILVASLLSLAGCATAPKPAILNPFQGAADKQAPPVSNPGDYKLRMVGHEFWGLNFYQGTKDQAYDYTQIASIAAASEEVKNRYNSALSNTNISLGFGLAGGFLVGFPIGYSISKPWGTTQTYMLAGGLGSLVVSYVFADFATGDFKKAIDGFNLKLQPGN